MFPQLFRVLPNFHECFYRPSFTKSPSLVLIRLVLTKMQPFENVKIYKEMYGHPDGVRHSIRLAIHFFVNCYIKLLYLFLLFFFTTERKKIFPSQPGKGRNGLSFFLLEGKIQLQIHILVRKKPRRLGLSSEHSSVQP